MTPGKALMDEIMQEHMKKHDPTQAAPVQEERKRVRFNDGEPEPVVSRKRKEPTRDSAPPKKESVEEPQEKRQKKRKASQASKNPSMVSVARIGGVMYTVEMVGGLMMSEYPLEKGEKLAVVKLTPIGS